MKQRSPQRFGHGLRPWILGVALCLVAALTSASPAQTQLVDFVRDIQPLLENKCLRCHGPELDEGGFSLADRELLADYLEPGDANSSTLFLVLHDEENFSLMPPEDEGGPLSAAEIALVRLWIDEGAAWPEAVILGGAVTDDPTASNPDDTSSSEPPTEAGPKTPPSQRPLAERLWAFHGYFHPAIVHFPIALFSVGALFVLLHWVVKGNFREMAFYCLALGALSSIVACTMGWAFAPERSMGGHLFDPDYKTFNHRWMGIAVAVTSCVFALIAIRARKSERSSAQFLWQVGVLLVAGLVGIVGHQGGELVYGEGIYDRAFEKYFVNDQPIVDSGVSQTAPADDETSNTTEDGPDAEPDGDADDADPAASDETAGDETTSETSDTSSSEDDGAGDAAAETDDNG